MPWKVFPSLCAPDWTYWEPWYPEGLGFSAFASPAWQRLMQREMEPGWRLMFLRSQAPERGRLSLPVFVRRDRWRRYEISVRPVAYCIGPIETPAWDAAATCAMVDAAQSWFTAGFTWWLPPWYASSPRDPSERQGMGTLMWSSVEAFLITLDSPADAFIASRVDKAQRRKTRATQDRGLEVLEKPAAGVIDEYYQLYMQVQTDRNWVGQPFSRDFFHGVARTLGQGGELIAMRYRGQIVGGGVLLYDRQAVYTFQSAIDRSAREVHPHGVFNTLAIQRAEARGLRYVNFGGINTGNDGLRQYKESWGAVATPVRIIRWRCTPPRIVKGMVGYVETLVGKKDVRPGSDGPGS